MGAVLIQILVAVLLSLSVMFCFCTILLTFAFKLFFCKILLGFLFFPHRTVLGKIHCEGAVLKKFRHSK